MLPDLATLPCCTADATPQELSTALMSAGSWGLVHEPAASGPLNANALAGTNNVVLNTNMFHAVDLQPESIQVRTSAARCDSRMSVCS